MLYHTRHSLVYCMVVIDLWPPANTCHCILYHLTLISVTGITQPTEYAAPWCQQPSMTIVNRLVDQAEAVHVLGLLLVGKNRERAQKVLADTKLIPGLSNTFDNFLWVFQG